ncbi:MAG: tetraacyldisaccharide 4'-kinase [Bacteroidota bacterium]
MRVLSLLLLPFTFLYSLITDLRNYLYDKAYLKSIRFEIFTINVGNLTVGGTGKTPHVEYLIRLLKNDYCVATLSRGYGRQTKGFILADEQANAAAIGDEPMQFHQRFGKQISVVVGEERTLAIPQLLFEKPQTNVILLDDAYQHRSVQPHLNLLLTDFHRLFTHDWPFPSGRLRERRKGAKRADIVVVSKCPTDLSEASRKEIEKEIRLYTQAGTPIFFSGIRYGEPAPFIPDQAAMGDSGLVLVSGIANPAPLVKYVSERYQLFNHCQFGDHHNYTERDIKKIREMCEPFAGEKKIPGKLNAISLLTTEKDYVKLRALPLATWAPGMNFFYLPMEIYFLANEGTNFDTVVRQSMKKHFLEINSVT